MLATVNDYIDLKLTHSVHTSGSKSFRGCRRRWNWLTNELYYPKVTVKPLEFGVAFHKAMEVLYDPELWTKNRQVVCQLAIVTFFKVCDAQFAKYEEAFGPAEPDVIKDYKERKALGRGMIEYCVLNGRQKDIDEGFKPLLVEVAFEVPIIDPGTSHNQDAYNAILSEKHPGDILWCKCDNCWDRWCRHVDAIEKADNPNWMPLTVQQARERTYHWKGLPVTYGGRIDCIMEGPDGRVWVVDWKTASQLSVDREEFLLLDDQVTRYCWAMRLLGYRMAGFLYHELLKAFPEEPEPLSRRRLGRLFSINKDQNTTAEIYERTVREIDSEAYHEGLYTDYIEMLKERDEHFFYRFKIYRNDGELDNAGRVIFDEAADQVDPNIRIYPNPGRFNCTNCAFRQPCLEANSGGDVLYTLTTLFDKKEYHYWEQIPLSTDRKSVS